MSALSLTGVQALGDRGRFNQVTPAQGTRDVVVKVSHQVLPSRGGHVSSLLATLQRDTDQESAVIGLKGNATFYLWKSQTSIHNKVQSRAHISSCKAFVWLKGLNAWPTLAKELVQHNA